jgi:hypothetical protein
LLCHTTQASPPHFVSNACTCIDVSVYGVSCISFDSQAELIIAGIELDVKGPVHRRPGDTCLAKMLHVPLLDTQMVPFAGLATQVSFGVSIFAPCAAETCVLFPRLSVWISTALGVAHQIPFFL